MGKIFEVPLYSDEELDSLSIPSDELEADMVAIGLINSINAYGLRGKYDVASKAFEKLKELYKVFSDSSIIANRYLMGLLGYMLVLVFKEDLSTIIQLFECAKNIVAKFGYKSSMIRTLIMMYATYTNMLMWHKEYHDKIEEAADFILNALNNMKDYHSTYLSKELGSSLALVIKTILSSTENPLEVINRFVRRLLIDDSVIDFIGNELLSQLALHAKEYDIGIIDKIKNGLEEIENEVLNEGDYWLIRLMTEIYGVIIRTYSSLGLNKEVERLLKRFDKSAKLINKIEGYCVILAKFYQKIFLMYDDEGDISKMIKILGKIEKVVRDDVEDLALIKASCYKRLALRYIYLGRINDAYKYSSKIIKLAEKLPFSSKIRQEALEAIHARINFYVTRKRESKTAEKVLEKALGLYRGFEKDAAITNIVAKCIGDVMVSYAVNRKRKKVEELLNKLREVIMEVDDPERSELFQSYIARLGAGYILGGEKEDGLRYLLKSWNARTGVKNKFDYYVDMKSVCMAVAFSKIKDKRIKATCMEIGIRSLMNAIELVLNNPIYLLNFELRRKALELINELEGLGNKLNAADLIRIANEYRKRFK